MDTRLDGYWPEHGQNYITGLEDRLREIRTDCLAFLQTASAAQAAAACEGLAKEIGNFYKVRGGAACNAATVAEGSLPGGGSYETVVLDLENRQKLRLIVGTPPEGRWNGRCIMALHGTHEHAGYFLGLLGAPRTSHESSVGFALPFIKQGYMVACPDLPCFGMDNPIADESSEAFNSYIFQVDALNRITGCSYLQQAVNRNVAATGYLLNRFPAIEHYAITGYSLGALVAVATAACDKRVQAVIEYMGITTLEQEINERTQLCKLRSYVYGSGFAASVGDHWCLSLACAPRPFLRVSKAGDENVLYQGVRDTAQLQQAAYSACGAAGRFGQVLHQGQHGLQAGMAEEGAAWLDGQLEEKKAECCG